MLKVCLVYSIGNGRTAAFTRGLESTRRNAVSLRLGESGACVGRRLSFGLNGFAQLSLRWLHGLQEEFGGIIAAKQQVVVIEGALRQAERFLWLSATVEIADV